MNLRIRRERQLFLYPRRFEHNPRNRRNAVFQGNYSGQLDTITVDGTTDTPDFSIDVSGHKVDLTTQFHAIVNGTNGNTYLQPVKAHFLHTDITATGDVVRARASRGMTSISL